MSDYERSYKCECGDCFPVAEIYLSPDHIKEAPFVMISVDDEDVWLSLDSAKKAAASILLLVADLEPE